jgi:hypothetical protein
MRVPESIARFLATATVAIAGTRDRELVPHGHRVSAWRLGEDRETLVLFFAECFTKHLLSSLEDNGELSVTVSEAPSHRTYQFKGTFVGTEPVREKDLAAFRSYRDEASGRIHELFGLSRDALLAYFPRPTLGVRFRVRDIFDQSPGPGAGRPVEEEEEGEEEEP